MARPPKILKREIRGLSKKGDADYEEFDDPNVEDLIDDDVDYEPEVYTESDAGLALRGPQALSAESSDALSVLESLREFLETERARSRNRTLTLAAVFSVLLLLSIMGGLLMIERLRQQTGISLGRLGEQQDATLEVQAESARVMAEITTRTRDLEVNLQKAGDQRDTSGALMETQIERQLEGFQMVRKVLSEVEIENAALAREYRTMRSEWASFTNAMQASIEDISKARPAIPARATTVAAVSPARVKEPRDPVGPAEPIEPVEPVEPVESVGEVIAKEPVEPWSPTVSSRGSTDRGDHVDLAINPKGSRRSISWRLPLP
ncbi:MAG: hypothetical protein O2923_06580 [Verrucomicrobia bacterium]|nr:hypothetical protein [Verrucomicrobiota bacterium]MDA1087627.1 hypothetical protein [Verrucomicrobiota bacterium]